MHAGSFISDDGERMEIRRIPDSRHIDPIVLDPLIQYFDGRLYRRWPSSVYYHGGTNQWLQRAVWESAFGKIPKGCHIHHRDNNPANNNLTNLECLPKLEHFQQRVHRHAPIPESTRTGAAAWHRSEAGRLWHRQQARKCESWRKRRRELKKCEFCGIEFMALIRSFNTQRFCSAQCRSSGRTAFDHSYDNHKPKNWPRESRTCAQCRGEFMGVVRSRNAQMFCSEPCRNTFNNNRKATGRRANSWKRESKKCDQCGVEFMAVVRTGNKQRFCSDQCRIANHSKRKTSS